MKYFFPFLLFLALTFSNGCIGDDVIFDTVPESVNITNPIDTLSLNGTWQFEAKFTNNIGAEVAHPVTWSSTNDAVLSIDNEGLATGVTQGTAGVIVKAEVAGKGPVADTIQVVVAGDTTVVGAGARSGTIVTTSSYTLKGSFVLKKDGDNLIMEVSNDYQASTNIPGLYVYLGNNPNSISNAYEIGKVQVFNGAHSYQIPSIGLNDYSYVLYWCKPFNVKVGEGKIN